MHDITFETSADPTDSACTYLTVRYNGKLLITFNCHKYDVIRIKAVLFALQSELFKEKIHQFEKDSTIKTT